MKRFLHAGERYALLCIKILFNYKLLLKSRHFLGAAFIGLNLMCFQVTLVNATALDARGEGAVNFAVADAKEIAQQDQLMLIGRVTDTAGALLEGVTISIKGSRSQVITNKEGRFQIRSASKSGVLILTAVGYKTIEERYGEGNSGPFVFMMEPTAQEIQEVEINAGYYNTTKRLSTGNIARIDASVISRQPVTNPLQTLNGQISGVRLIQSHGLPNHPISIEIRGRNSIRSGNEPLYIVDGVPYNNSNIAYVTIHGGVSAFSSINPNDIESISILKDADATAIYGSRGANGVVLISTKRAKTSQTTLDMEVARGFGSPTRLLEPLSTEQYLQVRRDAFANSGIEPTAANAPDLVLWDPNVDNKMQEWLVGTTVQRLQSSISLSGGTAQTLFKLSGNYHQENSIFDKDDLYRRGNVHFNLSQRMLEDKLQLDFTTFYSKDDQDLSGMQTVHLSNVAPFVPNYPLYDEKGDYNWIAGKTNYVAQALSSWKSKTDNLNAHLGLNYDILPGLLIKGNIGVNRIFNSSSLPNPVISKNPSWNQLGDNSFAESVTQSFSYESQLDYRYQLKQHHFHILGGGTIQAITADQNRVAIDNYINDLLINSRSGGTPSIVNSTHSEYRYISLFTRMHYNWNERYILNLTARRDGSSRFGPGKRFGTFGSIGAAWLFAEEPTIQDNFAWLSTGKLRGSYGTSGNDNIGNYAYLSVYNNVADYGNQKAIAPNQLANDNYHWEVNRKLEFATELGLWNDRLTADVAWYRNRSDNQLVAYPLPATTGFTSYTANMPALVQNQGWEVDMRIRAIQRKQFNWTASLNWTRHRNKLLEFPNIEGTSYASSLVIGESLSSILRYKFIEVNPQTGVTLVEDTNGDGVITGRSSYNNQGGDLVLAGSSDPSWSGGLTNSFSWRNLQLDISLQYVEQGGYNSFVFGYSGFGQLNNRWVTYLDYWKQPGDIGKLPKPFASANSSLSQFNSSTAVFGDASFLRLNNVSISYKIKNWTIYANGQNLMTWTKYNGYDPENVTSNQARFPQLKMLVFGVRTTFR